jgi:hypothetical protein
MIMNNIKYFLTGASLFVLPLVTSAQIATAQGGGGQFETLLENVLVFTNNILIPFILGIGFLFFVWGVFYYFIAGGANDEKKEKGRSLIIYSILGFVLIIVFWGVINLLADSLFGGDAGELDPDNIPTVGVPSQNPNQP